MERPYRDAEWLREQYHAEGLTQREIAEECGVVPCTIRRWMKRHGIETREIVGENHGLYGKERDENTRRKISQTMEGREFSSETRALISEANRGREFPQEVREKISKSLRGIARSDETRMKMSRSTSGKNNPNWKGGRYTEEWYGPGWTIIREQIRDRDEICQLCGHDGSQTDLDVHHIIPIRKFREKANVSLEKANHEANLILLRRRCHGRVEHGSVAVSPIDPDRFESEVLPYVKKE